MVSNGDTLAQELDAFVEKELKDNDTVIALLTNAKQRYKEVEVFGVPIKIRTVVPKDIRHQSEKSKDDPNSGKLDFVETITYTMLAGMCIEAPYTKPEFWKIVDDETGSAPETLTRFFDAANDTQKTIKTFRGK